MQHGELLPTRGVEIALKIGNGKWRNADGGRDHEVDVVEGTGDGTPNIVQFAPALNVFGGGNLGPGPEPF